MFMTFGTLPIFLNMYKIIRENYNYSLLSFLLLPLIISIISILYMADFKESILEYSAMFIPFLSVLILFFIKFRKSKYIKD